MIEKFRLANQPIPRYALAPLHGISDLVTITTILKHYPLWPWACLEFLRIPATHFSSKLLNQFLYKKGGPPLSAHSALWAKMGLQLLVAPNSRLTDFMPCLADLPFTWLDLNLGCCAPVVLRHGGGAALLRNLAALALIIKTLRQAWPQRLSLKLRPGIRDLSLLPTLLKMAEEEGVDAVIIHGRLTTENFTMPAHQEFIQQAAHLSKLPIIGNGDLDTQAAGEQMMQATGAVGAMYGRAGLGRPWLLDPVFPTASAHPLQKFKEYLTYLQDAYLAQQTLRDQQILARFKALTHWQNQMPSAVQQKLWHQQNLKDFWTAFEAALQQDDGLLTDG